MRAQLEQRIERQSQGIDRGSVRRLLGKPELMDDPARAPHAMPAIIGMPQIKAGSLRPIVIGSPERAPTAMEVPTTAEAGMPDLKIENWYGMVAPAGTPPAIVASLNRIATEAMRDPAVKEKLASQGAELVGDTPEHFRGFIEAEIRKWAGVIRDAGVATEK